jgi:hypothetical protein
MKDKQQTRGRSTNAQQKKMQETKVPTHGVPGSEQDPKRRLGNFTGAGEHARKGGRSTGIVGQTKQRFRSQKPKAGRS